VTGGFVLTQYDSGSVATEFGIRQSKNVVLIHCT
jgi:hypothetical protein